MLRSSAHKICSVRQSRTSRETLRTTTICSAWGKVAAVASALEADDQVQQAEGQGMHGGPSTDFRPDTAAAIAAVQQQFG